MCRSHPAQSEFLGIASDTDVGLKLQVLIMMLMMMMKEVDVSIRMQIINLYHHHHSPLLVTVLLPLPSLIFRFFDFASHVEISIEIFHEREDQSALIYEANEDIVILQQTHWMCCPVDYSLFLND